MLIRNATVDDLDEVSSVEAQCFPVQEAATAEVFSQRLKYYVTAAAAGMVSLCLSRGKKWVLPTVVWVLLMGFARNYLMAHYPSDVLFAVIIGVASAFIAWAITKLIFRFLEKHDGSYLCALILDFDPRQYKNVTYKGKH